MNNSWHYDSYRDKSLINDLLSLINEERYLEVYIDGGKCFTLTDKEDISVGMRAMMIAEDNKVSLINTDKVRYFQLIGAVQRNDKSYNKKDTA